MRICDICRGDTIETWSQAVVHITVEAISSEAKLAPRFQAWDVCQECLNLNELPIKEKEVKDDPAISPDKPGTSAR